MKKILTAITVLLVSHYSQAQFFIRGSVKKNANPLKIDVVFKPTYTSVAGEYASYLQIALAVPAPIGAGVTATAVGVNTFSNMGTLTAIPPYLEPATGEWMFVFIFIDPALATQSWTANVEFVGVEVTFSTCAAAEVAKMVDHTNIGGGTNGQAFFSMGLAGPSPVPGLDPIDYSNYFFPVTGQSSLGTYPNTDQYVQTLAPCITALGGTAVKDTTFCAPGGTPKITATGYSTGLLSGYQWMSSANSANYPFAGTPIAGQIKPDTLTTVAISATTYYWLRVTCGSCNPDTAYSNLVTIAVLSNNTVGPPTNTTACINTVLSPNITHTTAGATGIGVATGLPAGLTAAWAANTITISGTPTVSGTFNYTIPLTGGCGPTINATGTITVTAPTTVGLPSTSPTVCINTALTNITHSTTNATGIGAATGLPGGVTAAWAPNTITISGTPTASGTFAYTIPVTGSCGNVNATGAITVRADNTVGAPTSTTLCINTALSPSITHTTTGATGIGTPSGLPGGVTATWAANTITISGTPAAAGTFNYSIPLTGGCGNYNATGTINVTTSNTAGSPTSTALCINTALSPDITHATTGATGIGAPTNLPLGLTAAWAGNTLTISGTPTASGTFNYTIPLTGGCGNINATGTITVKADNTVGSPTSTTVCLNTPLTPNITHTTTGATGIGSATGLPLGVTAAWAANTITISGSPNTSGTFSYTIPLIGGCNNINATGTINVTTSNTVSPPTSTTLCINTAVTPNITHTTGGATGIGTATGLPGGVTATWAANTITISGTPIATGTFNYTVPLTGGCGSFNATGTITVTANNTAGVPSSTPTICINSALTNITHNTTGATGIGVATGLPLGVTAAWAPNTITISGTPTNTGTFAYIIPLTGGCGSVNAIGTITVRADNTVGPPSATPTLCINTTLPGITHSTTNATGIGTATGLPAGVTAAWAANTITISGTPTASGTFNYTIPLTGCGGIIAAGTITVTANNTFGAPSATPTLCINSTLTNITHITTGATGIGIATNLPPGVTAAWAANTITISGTPTVSGAFNYSIPLTGGCGSINATGMITVSPSVTPAVSITASGNNVCVGTSVTFTATSTDGGSAPDYQWQINNINVVNSPTFTSTTLNDGDIVTVILTSNAACATTTTATSNSIAMTVITTTVTPSVTIAASQPQICYGDVVTFTATAINGGNSPSYLWQLNGNIVGTNSSIFISNTLADGDSITCLLTSSASCPSPPFALSDVFEVSIDKLTCPTGFYFPTAFTPNNDGKNDIFKPTLYGVLLKYKMSIFNRWGQKVFETTDLQKGWDGKLAGNDQNSNVFVWQCTYQMEDQPVEYKKGTVVMLR